MVAWAFICVAPAAAAAAAAAAAVDTPRLDDYHRDVWTAQAGAPVDIFGIAQTADGWLWLATPNGLYRFDGVRFERFEARAGEALLSERLANMYAAPNGDLWFGYPGGGVTMLRNGHLTHHNPASPNIGPWSVRMPPRTAPCGSPR